MTDWTAWFPLSAFIGNGHHCDGSHPDYLCPGWKRRADKIRNRDGYCCRGCGRSSNEVVLQVHHRVYNWAHGRRCGKCFLLGVDDNDLTTLCVDCHQAITEVRRALWGVK